MKRFMRYFISAIVLILVFSVIMVIFKSNPKEELTDDAPYCPFCGN